MPRSATRASTCRWTCALRSPPKVAEVALGERRVRADLPGERTLVQQDAHDHCDAVLQASGQQMLLRRLVEHVIDACRGTRRARRVRPRQARPQCPDLFRTALPFPQLPGPWKTVRNYCGHLPPRSGGVSVRNNLARLAARPKCWYMPDCGRGGGRVGAD